MPIAPLLGLVIAAESLLSFGTESFASNLLCDLALIAALVAACERRHTAMMIAAGLACGLGVFGAMLVPLAIGLAVSRRIAARLLMLVPLSACAAIILLGAPPLVPSAIGVWSTVFRPETTGLLVALALGSLAWLTATLSARPLMPDMVPTAALTCALTYALVMPGVSIAIPLALTFRYGARRLVWLVAFAALMAAFALPIPATLALAAALVLAARPLLPPFANDNAVSAARHHFAEYDRGRTGALDGSWGFREKRT